jgi:hypothetical protein
LEILIFLQAQSIEVVYGPPRLDYQTRVQRDGVTNAACTLCGRNETTEHVFCKCSSAMTFWAWFQSEFNSFLLLYLPRKAVYLGTLA